MAALLSLGDLGCEPDLCAETTCTALDACHKAGVCNPTTGECSNPTQADGTACDDGDACTQMDTCKAGSCTGSKLVAEYQVWHGSPSHTSAYADATWKPNNRPYDSRDPAVIARHIAAAKAMGICGFVVDWYGPGGMGYSNDEDRQFQDDATTALFAQAEASPGFSVALLYDEGAAKGSGSLPNKYQTIVEADLAYASQHYFGSPAYLPLDGKPALFVFAYDDVDPQIDWAVMRTSLGVPVTLFDRDPNPLDPAHDASFDGFFAWVSPDSADPMYWGDAYLDWFYSTMATPEYKTKIAVGGVWPGFDDSIAPWSQHRLMSRRGREVYDLTWNRAQQAGVPVTMIGTWNDSEEGTDIEFGIEMIVDLEKPDPEDPEILVRSSPLEITWDPALGPATLQIYKEGSLYKEFPMQAPGEHFSFLPQTAYEIKIWINGAPSPRAKTIKIRGQDPIPGVTPISADP